MPGPAGEPPLSQHQTRAGEAGVVHRPVPAVAHQVERRVVAVLGEQPGVRPHLVHRPAQRAGHVVGEVVGPEPAGHVGHVDAPAVEPALAATSRRPSRARRTDGARARPRRGRASAATRCRATRRSRATPGPAGAEPVERRARGCSGSRWASQEPVVVVAGVVGGEVAHQPQPARVHGVDQPRRARRRRRAAGRRGRTTPRRSGGSTRPRRRGSGRPSSRPAPRRGRGAR